MSYFTTFVQKAFCAAAEKSAAAASACGFFRITMDAVLCAGSIFAILALLGTVAGIIVPVVVLVGLWILAIGVLHRSAMARRAS